MHRTRVVVRPAPMYASTLDAAFALACTESLTLDGGYDSPTTVTTAESAPIGIHHPCTVSCPGAPPTAPLVSPDANANPLPWPTVLRAESNRTAPTVACAPPVSPLAARRATCTTRPAHGAYARDDRASSALALTISLVALRPPEAAAAWLAACADGGVP